MDKDFAVNSDGLHRAVELMSCAFSKAEVLALPTELPPVGLGSTAALNLLAPSILGGAARLGEATSLAHMDPPTPWIAWALTLWNASLNQNLLHPATSPVARQMEERVVAWLAPFFGMNGGHMTPGSTVANLTALWAARECAGVTEVIASDGAHLSIAKAAHILGLKYLSVPIDAHGSMDAAQLPADLRKSALVLTAGATSTGAIDPLDLTGRAAWTHVDAAWAGPLRVSKHAHLLAGIEWADLVAISAHKCGGAKALRSALSTAWTLPAACEILWRLTSGFSFGQNPKLALWCGALKTSACLTRCFASCLLVRPPPLRLRV